MSVAFTKEESAETASEKLLPDRPISPHPNFVTATGLDALKQQLSFAQQTLETVQSIEDVNERRREGTVALRDARYLAERIRTAQIVPRPTSAEVVAFGTIVTFTRGDGRTSSFRIVGEDEAEPKAGSISFASPMAKSLLGRRVGDVVESNNQEIEVVSIAL